MNKKKSKQFTKKPTTKKQNSGSKTNKCRGLKNCVRKALGQIPLFHLCTCKAQAGLEYFVTYSWVLVLIAAVIGALVFLASIPATKTLRLTGTGSETDCLSSLGTHWEDAGEEVANNHCHRFDKKVKLNQGFF